MYRLSIKWRPSAMAYALLYHLLHEVDGVVGVITPKHL